MFFPHHLIGAEAVEGYLRGWVDAFGSAVDPDGAPTFSDVAGDVLVIERFSIVWSSDVTVTVEMDVDVTPDRPAEPTFVVVICVRDGAMAWRYCRNTHFPADPTNDHLHLGPATIRRVPLTEPLTMDHVTSRILAEPR